MTPAPFDMFIGKPVNVVETVYKGYKNKEYKVQEVDKQDKIIEGIRNQANKFGYELRIWLPDSCGTCDFIENRLNVHIEKEADSIYRVKKFSMG